MKPRKTLVVYYVHNYKTLELVCRELARNEIENKCVKREKLSRKLVKGKDAVIVVGGDGTFLRTAYKVNKTPILAVTSDEKKNEGFYARATKKDFARKAARLAAGKFKITKLPRLEARINGKKLPLLAINEIFIGSRHPYHTSRYVLEAKGRKEFQKSSGLLITTRTGSSGWAKSAAKRALNIPKKGFGFVVREPYFGRLSRPKMLHGHLGSKEKLKVKSMTHKGIAVVDSSEKEFRFEDGDKMEVKVSKRPLYFIEF